MLRFYNSLTKRTEPFEPLVAGQVGLYTCGPTVHDFAHIGNFRTFVWEDLLRRHLEWRGYHVRHVMNITDIEDKIIRKASAAGVEIGPFTEQYTAAFLQDIQTLRLLPAHELPRATRYIREMIELIQQLEAKGMTYLADGSVYFRIANFDDYGKLMGFERENLRAGSRVDADEYEKEDPADFVLWKGHKPGEPVWDSPWGPGRPGWHIECSAMSIALLGPSFDIHTGGIDNKFPHHENEIAQSEPATGKKFVRYWMHSAHLVVSGEKMAKSAGNFYTLRDLLQAGHKPRELRYLLIGTHYRKTLDFSFTALEQAKTELERVDVFRARLNEAPAGAPTAFAERAAAALSAYRDCLDDDLNVSGAAGEVFKLVREGNAALDRNALTQSDALAVEQFFQDADRTFACWLAWEQSDAAPAEVEALLAQRQAARAAKDWAASDRLRDQILALGWVVEDTHKGARLKHRGPENVEG
jgi:cysteinyl-tRNA synthetase